MLVLNCIITKMDCVVVAKDGAVVRCWRSVSRCGVEAEAPQISVAMSRGSGDWTLSASSKQG